MKQLHTDYSIYAFIRYSRFYNYATKTFSQINPFMYYSYPFKGSNNYLFLSHKKKTTTQTRLLFCLGMTALHFAAKSSPSGDAVKTLIAAGANINAPCAASAYTWFFQSIDRDLQTHMFTPLHFAALACNADTVTLLLKNKANPRDKDGKGRTPLNLLTYHAQHIGAPYKDNYYKTRERLKRPHVEYPPAAEQEVPRDPTPEVKVVREPLDLKSIRRGLIRVRNDLVSDYDATSDKFKEDGKGEKALKAIADEFESKTNTRVAEATEYMNAAIDILKDAESTKEEDPYDDFAYYRVFSAIAKEVGGKKGQWQALAKALFEKIEGLKAERYETCKMCPEIY